MPIFKINLNNSEEFTVEGIRKLIASVDDSIDRQFRITLDGYAVITDHDGPEDMEFYAARSGTWEAGNRNSGAIAALDTDRMEYIYQVVMQHRNTRGRALVLDI